MTTARDHPPEEAAEDTSFARGLRLLLMVADRGEVRADDLGALLDMPMSTVYRYLRTLGEFGFVERHDGLFRLGPKLHIGTGSIVTTEDLIRVTDAPLRMLVHDTGETAVVVRRIGLSAVCLHQVECDQALRVALEPGAMLPLHAGALGRVLLAYAPREVLDEVLEQDLDRVPTGTPTEEALRSALDEIVRTGTATSEGESIDGSVALVAPVFREDGIVGAIGLLGPSTRCGARWQARARRRLAETAWTINAALAD